MSVARTVIIEDEILVANMLEGSLGRLPEVQIVGVAHSGKSGVKLCQETKPHLVLLDIEMPSQNGLDVARKLRNELPQTHIIVVSSHCEPYAVHELSRLNVESFVDKGDPLATLYEAIRMVLAGNPFYSKTFSAVRLDLRLQAESYQKILSSREIEVLIMVAEGRDDKDIARRLDVSPITISTHRRNIRMKLRAHNDRDLTNYARKVGLVPLTWNK